MSVVYVMVPLALLLAGGAVAGFIWAVKGEQFSDLDTPAERVALDDD